MSGLIAMLALWAACGLADYLPVWEPISRKCCGWIEQDRPYAAFGLFMGALAIEGVCVIVGSLLIGAITTAALGSLLGL